MMDSAGVPHGFPMDKGTKSSKSKMDKSVRNKKAPVLFRSYKEALMSNVDHPGPTCKVNKLSDSDTMANAKKVSPTYTPLSFFYTMGSTVDHLGPMRKGNKSSESNMDKKRVSIRHYIPLSFYTTVVTHPGPTDNGNKSSDTKVSRNSISDQVALSILSKLSVKSLKRFGCVRKSWSVLFENSDFMTLYTKHFISRHASDSDSDNYHTFILSSQMDLHVKPPGRRSEFHLLDIGIKVNLPPPCQQSGSHRSILNSTSVNGIFCLAQEYPIDLQYVLWNPATEEFWVIPRSHIELTPIYPQSDLFLDHAFHGFGYDQVRDDFKVVQYVTLRPWLCFNPTVETYFEIYSLKNNSWRTIDMENVLNDWCFSGSFYGREVYVNGACHWLFSIRNYNTEMILLSFDLSDEVFLITPIGEEPSSPYSKNARLAVLNGSIALFSNYDDDIVFHISILGELGVSESWIKLYIYGPLSSIKWPPIGFGKTGYPFFFKRDNKLAYVDLSTQRIEEVGTITDGEESFFQVGHYKESLLSICGSSN